MLNCNDNGILGMVTGVIGSLQALEAVKLIVATGETVSGRLIVFDALLTEFNDLKLRQDPNCPLCGSHPSVTELVEYEIKCKAKGVST